MLKASTPFVGKCAAFGLLVMLTGCVLPPPAPDAEYVNPYGWYSYYDYPAPYYGYYAYPRGYYGATTSVYIGRTRLDHERRFDGQNRDGRGIPPRR